MNEGLKLTLTDRDGTERDLSGVYESLNWSGNCRQLARQLSVNLLAVDERVRTGTEKGSLVRLYLDGKALFYGYVTGRTASAGRALMELQCMDRGWFLARNDGWYSFRATPERAVRTICAEHGIPVGTLAETGVTVRRKFPGVELYKIISTLYTEAAKVNGKRYHIGFDGTGALCVREKGAVPVETELIPRVNLVDSTVEEDISNICTQVAIYREDGTLLRVMDEPERLERYGRFRSILTRGGGNAEQEARNWLEDNDERQTVTAECLGDPALVTGAAVVLHAQHSGAAGLFWIDGDTHTWRNGQYTCTLELNFRNLMNETSAGKEL